MREVRPNQRALDLLDLLVSRLDLKILTGGSTQHAFARRDTCHQLKKLHFGGLLSRACFFLSIPTVLTVGESEELSSLEN